MTLVARVAHTPTRHPNPDAARSSEKYSHVLNRGIRPTFNERRTTETESTKGGLKKKGIIIQTSSKQICIGKQTTDDRDEAVF